MYKLYTSTNLIRAKLTTYKEYCDEVSIKVAPGRNPNESGYMYKYGRHIHWAYKKDFEQAYVEAANVSQPPHTGVVND